MALNHEANNQVLGYLYQIRCALLLLLKNSNNDSQICIEKFDDISFINNGSPRELIQTKHHINNKGKLTDLSVDLWRTIKSWCDTINGNNLDIENINFVIVTTDEAPKYSAAYYLKGEHKNRDHLKAYEKLYKAIESSTSEKNKKYYEAFLNMGEKNIKEMLRNTYIYDNTSNVAEIIEDIKGFIKYGTLPEYENQIIERIEGWWYRKAIECLQSEDPIFISQYQLRTIIKDIMDEYTNDNLPIDIEDIIDITEDDLEKKERVFIEQLKLIALSEKRLNRAIRDYYRAYQQRAKWIRNDLLYTNELEKYENRLKDEWERLFLIMEEEIEDYGESINENIKIQKGKELFNHLESRDINIRAKCTEPFIMRGTLHELSNNLEIGWHIDFEKKLCHLLRR